MAKDTILLGQFLRLIPTELFDSLTTRYSANRGAQLMTARAHLATLAYAQVAGLVLLREIEQATASLTPLQRASELVSARRSTLAEANQRISWMLYCDLFHHLLGLLRNQLSRKASVLQRSYCRWTARQFRSAWKSTPGRIFTIRKGRSIYTP